MKTAIVTDTNSSISAKEAQEMGIDLIPMPFFVDGETYLEGKDCTPETFFQRMKAGAEISTSQPAPEEITSLWDTLLKTHDAVLHFPMSSGLSGSCHTAKADNYPGVLDGVILVKESCSNCTHIFPLAEA